MKKGHLVNAGKTNPKRTQNKANFRGKKMLLSTFMLWLSKEKMVFCNRLTKKSQID